jgi:hypothetical protein
MKMPWFIFFVCVLRVYIHIIEVLRIFVILILTRKGGGNDKVQMLYYNIRENRVARLPCHLRKINGPFLPWNPRHVPEIKS